uniref:AlNc14C143G7303 protein n=1 Tax=Albugo laibachii Nc14 TaxID=890382 RepID=F0WLB5_9STRA|nr:AlNc14C143G7303 [Albugo laibachii Nc14]|eukprot:CCA22078.1 AlNc14C143G7303 [Albugo laibachii Nc14]
MTFGPYRSGLRRSGSRRSELLIDSGPRQYAFFPYNSLIRAKKFQQNLSDISFSSRDENVVLQLRVC